MQKLSSLEKIVMLGKVERKRRRGQPEARWMDSGEECTNEISESPGQGKIITRKIYLSLRVNNDLTAHNQVVNQLPFFIQQIHLYDMQNLVNVNFCLGGQIGLLPALVQQYSFLFIPYLLISYLFLFHTCHRCHITHNICDIYLFIRLFIYVGLSI